MGEVHDLSLDKSKMVVLSACSTFKGELRLDGVVGITRAFIAAGLSAVVASMWPVGDKSTKEMMRHLYVVLFGCGEDKQDSNGENVVCGNFGNFDVCSALQQVVIEMLDGEKSQHSIKDWVPFIVYGSTFSTFSKSSA